ncbi:MAG: oligosaccharide flippase family protein [Actinomycetota bacterium]|nr:oligosaccharide flippase family protein [Actinomycetota bacterium]
MALEAERELSHGTAQADSSQPRHILELVKQTMVYGLSGVALQVVGVITLPILARVFTPAEYGRLELASVLLAAGLALADFGFASAAQRSFFDYSSGEPGARRIVISTALFTTTIIGILVAVVLILVRDPASRLLFGHAPGAPLVVTVAIAIPLVNTATFIREAMRLRFRAWQYVASSALASVVAGALGILGVVGFNLHVRGIFVGIIVGNLLAAAYGAVVLRRDISRHFSSHELRPMLKYGAPLIVVAVAMWALTLVDRIMLRDLGSLPDVGEYAVANRVANVLLLGVTGFALAFGPYIFSIYSEDRDLERAVRAQALRYLTIGLTTIGLVLALFAREIIAIVAPAFGQAYEVVGLLVLAVVSFGISSVAMAGVSYARRTDVLAGITLSAAALNIGLNFILIPPFGMVGAALANLSAYLLLAALYYVVAQRMYPTPYELGKLLTITGLASAFGILGVVPIHPLAADMVAKAAALFAFIVLLRTTGVVESAEINRLRELLGSAWRIATQRA